MHEANAAPAWVLIAYLISGICFILALRGLSSPESSRRGNRAGIIGMGIALATTLIHYMPTRDEEFPLQWHDPIGWSAPSSASSRPGGSR
jgi:NAD(P) transhydrogenase subunit beta